MPNQTPTLAEVLEADANAYARSGAAPRELEEAQHWAELAHANALQYLLANREWLERAEWERAARRFWPEAGETCPVLVVKGSRAKPTLGSVEYRGGAPLVIVGADWKPEVQGG